MLGRLWRDANLGSAWWLAKALVALAPLAPLAPLTMSGCGDDASASDTHSDSVSTDTSADTGSDVTTVTSPPDTDAIADDDATRETAPDTTTDTALETDTDGDTGSDSEIVADGPTWHRDVKPIINQHCATCHVYGGSAPFALTSYADALTNKDDIDFMVRLGEMPPWPADPNCRHYARERLMTQAERDTLLAWTAGDAVEGDPADHPESVPAVPLHLPKIDIEATGPTAYTPVAGVTDDYHCVVIQHTFAADTFLTGYEIFPDVGPLVHHVAVFVGGPESAADIKALDDAEAGPGYTCFGGAGFNKADLVGAWVPGSGAQLFPDDAAYVIPAGSTLIMQMHYNLLTAAPAPDLTRLTLATRATPPTKRLRVYPMAHTDLVIQAGDAHAENVRDFVNDSPKDFTIVGYLPHMHLLGDTMRAAIVTPGVEGEDACLVDIPHWDFHWQETYMFQEPAVLKSGQAMRLSCVFDNSADNQPEIDGVQQEPRDVTWGESTTDEMCVGVVLTVEPYVAP